MSAETFLLLIAIAVIILIVVRRIKKMQNGNAPGHSSESQNVSASKSTSTEPVSDPAPKTSAKPAPEPAAKSAEKKPAPQAHGAATGVPEALAVQASELQAEKDPVARHRLLQQLTEQTYKDRKDPAMREACRTFSEQHMDEFSDIKAPLKKSNGGKLPHVPTFQNFANLLVEDGNFGKAIEVCEKALEFGLDDKTKSGFKGRIERIKKQQEKAAG